MSSSKLSTLKGQLARSEKTIKDLAEAVRASQKKINQTEAELTFYKERSLTPELQAVQNPNLEKIIRSHERRIGRLLLELSACHSDKKTSNNSIKENSDSLTYNNLPNPQIVERLMENLINEASSLQNSRILKTTRFIGSKLPDTSAKILAQLELLNKTFTTIYGGN